MNNYRIVPYLETVSEPNRRAIVIWPTTELELAREAVRMISYTFFKDVTLCPSICFFIFSFCTHFRTEFMPVQNRDIFDGKTDDPLIFALGVVLYREISVQGRLGLNLRKIHRSVRIL